MIALIVTGQSGHQNVEQSDHQAGNGKGGKSGIENKK